MSRLTRAPWTATPRSRTSLTGSTRSARSTRSPRPRRWPSSPTSGRREGLTNIWGNVPVVQEMQSEGGAAGAVHGALQSGALTTTFTASQGLMLMLPNMFKIAGELTATVFHVAARALATQALSIFGDHSDVMAARTTGFALLSLRLGAGGARRRADRAGGDAGDAGAVPAFLRRLPDLARAQHADAADRRADPGDDRQRSGARAPGPRAQSRAPVHPRHRAQPGHVLSGARDGEPVSTRAVPAIVQAAMERFAALTGRQYKLFEYDGAAGRRTRDRADGLRRGDRARDGGRPAAARARRSACCRCGCYRPFAAGAFLAALPRRCRADRGARADQGARRARASRSISTSVDDAGAGRRARRRAAPCRA